MFGEIQTATGSHFRPTFPPLPTEQRNNFGGYFGPIDLNTFDLYTEFPSPGVVAEGVRHAVSQDDPGGYPSSLDDPARNLVVTDNLQGWRPLTARRPEAKSLAISCGITENRFRETYPHTAINMPFLDLISGVLSKLTTFKNMQIVFPRLGPGGSIAQTIFTRLYPDPDLVRDAPPYLDQTFQATSLTRESIAHFGLATFVNPNLIRQSPDGQQPTWAPAYINDDVPQDWIQNANRRRTLPVEYEQQRFIGTPHALSQWIHDVVHKMVVAKR